MKKSQAYESQHGIVMNSLVLITLLPQLPTHSQKQSLVKHLCRVWSDMVYLDLINLAFFIFLPYVLKLWVLQVHSAYLFIIIY